MDNNLNKQTNPALKNLSRLVGKWDVELIFPAAQAGKTHVQAAFNWLEGGAFLVEHLATSTWIMEPDGSTETYSTLYHDERGVSRVYQMSLSGNLWMLWRNSPDFSQRFAGKFSEDDHTITACWEKSSDGSTWEHEFDLTYTKVS